MSSLRNHGARNLLHRCGIDHRRPAPGGPRFTRLAPADTPAAASLHSYDLGPDEAWQVILYLYRETGFEPRKEEQRDHTGH